MYIHISKYFLLYDKETNHNILIKYFLVERS